MATVNEFKPTDKAGEIPRKQFDNSPRIEELNAKITDLRILKGEQDTTIMRLQQENDSLKLQLITEIAEKERLGKALLSETSEKEKLQDVILRKDTEFSTVKEVGYRRCSD